MSFKEFENESNETPMTLRQNVQGQVHALLQPSWGGVLGKLTLIHFLTAAVTLSLCPQFGFRLFGQHLWSLFDLFMIFGHTVCTLLCGAFFLGSSVWVSRFLLTPEEWHKLQGRSFVPVSYLVAFSLVAFAILDAQFGGHQLVLWIVGAALMGFLILRGAPARVSVS